MFQSCGDGSFLAGTSTKQKIMCLAQKHNAVALVMLKQATLNPVSSSLTLSQRAPRIYLVVMLF